MTDVVTRDIKTAAMNIDWSALTTAMSGFQAISAWTVPEVFDAAPQVVRGEIERRKRNQLCVGYHPGQAGWCVRRGIKLRSRLISE